jgi:hypothetical protein
VTLTVAIASEHDAYDGRLYELLLGRLLARPVVRWTGSFVFNGCKAVAKLCDGFLKAAEAHGIRHALLAVDNDGGARRRPEHEAAHVPPPFELDDDDGCRECWLGAAVPPSWRIGDRRSCVVVPVQVVETWLLVLRGQAFSSPTPEQYYGRTALKKAFFGKRIPPLATRVALAEAELARPNAIDVLRERPSFQRFAERVRDW